MSQISQGEESKGEMDPKVLFIRIERRTKQYERGAVV